MSTTNPWARHYLNVWEERAGDSRLPMWLRVACLAYGKRRANGHAQFAAGQVALVMSTVDPDTQMIIPTPRQSVHRAIAKAVEFGWLVEGSTSRCLIVPSHAITGGMGSPTSKCRVHHGKTRSRGSAS